MPTDVRMQMTEMSNITGEPQIIIMMIISSIRLQLFQPHRADQMPVHQEMGQLLECTPFQALTDS